MPQELDRLEAKIDAGADYVMTQPVFDSSALATIEPYRNSTPVLPGVMVLRSAAHAERISRVPGVNLPHSVIEHLSKFDDPTDQAKVGLELAVAQVQLYKTGGWSGLYLMSPASLVAAKEVLKTLAE
jgi:5,10-methylenetetrahydrofolate reductase